MPEKATEVSGYLKELRESKKEKPEQIREALDVYIQLWESVMEKGLVRPGDRIEDALKKIEASGGLYKAAEG